MKEHLYIYVLSCRVQTDQIDSGQKVPVYFWPDWQKLADFARRACSLRCELVREKKNVILQSCFDYVIVSQLLRLKTMTNSLWKQKEDDL